MNKENDNNIETSNTIPKPITQLEIPTLNPLDVDVEKEKSSNESEIKAAIARTIARPIALYFKFPIKLFRPVSFPTYNILIRIVHSNYMKNMGQIAEEMENNEITENNEQRKSRTRRLR